MMNRTTKIIVHIICIGGLFFSLVVCFLQYSAIQKNRILNLSTTFYYMQEVIYEESDTSFQNWEKKAELLYRFEDQIPETESLGDFDEIKTIIHNVSQIRNPTDIEAASLISKVKEMEIAWNTNFGRWNIQIIKE